MHEDYEQNSFLFLIIVFQFLVDFILWRMKNKKKLFLSRISNFPLFKNKIKMQFQFFFSASFCFHYANSSSINIIIVIVCQSMHMAHDPFHHSFLALFLFSIHFSFNSPNFYCDGNTLKSFVCELQSTNAFVYMNLSRYRSGFVKKIPRNN